jgi:hypothetical protein
MVDVFTRQNAIDVLFNFSKVYTNDEKKLIWKLVRYVNLIIYIKLEYGIELHCPRSSIEKFTYESDKLWSKIIYYLIYINNNDNQSLQLIYEYIIIGGYVNLKKYWYDILPKKENYNHELIYYTDTSYSKLKSCKPYSDSTMDFCIINVLYYIKNNVYTMDDNLSKIMLEYIINKNNITKIIKIKFIDYLNSSYIDPCRETENKMDIYNLLYDYIVLFKILIKLFSKIY